MGGGGNQVLSGASHQPHHGQEDSKLSVHVHNVSICEDELRFLVLLAL